jgi:Leucine-rich repeat (LRR) protein
MNMVDLRTVLETRIRMSSDGGAKKYLSARAILASIKLVAIYTYCQGILTELVICLSFAHNARMAALQEEIVDLGGAGLTDIPQSVFQSSPRALNLHRNRLVELPSEIGRLKELEVLILSENQLASLPEEIGELENLRTLDLGHNRLASLPASFSKLKGLKDYLYLHDNCLTGLDDGVFEAFAGLRYLNLSGNRGLRLPSSLSKLQNLEELRLEDIELSELPASIGLLGALDELCLRNNHLESLPESMAGMVKLTRLDLRGNRFQKIPEVLRHLPKLNKIDLRWNPLSEAPSWLAELENRGTRILL